MFIHGIDFFYGRSKILLTQAGEEKIKNSKLTGSKFPYFFYIDENMCYWRGFNNERRPITDFLRWRNFINFCVRYKARDKYLIERENEIRELVNKSLNRKFIGQELHIYDVFQDYDFLGGVPDGEEIVEENGVNNYKTVLEIKTVRPDENADNKIFIDHQLQLVFYAYLRNLSEGYLAIAFINKQTSVKGEIVSLDKEFSVQSKHSELSTVFLQEKQIFTYSYTVVEKYSNDKKNIFLYKIKFDRDEVKKMIESAHEYFRNLPYYSPDLNSKDYDSF